MMKRIRYILMIMAMLCGLGVIDIAVSASLEQLRIANVLINEAGGLGEKSMTYVAEIMRNQFNEQHKGNSKITYSDILFHTWKAGGDSNFQHARDKFANKDASTLERMGSERGKQYWSVAMRLAGQLLDNSLTTNYTGGSNAFHGCNKKYTTIAQAQACEPKYTIKALDVTPKGFNNHVFYNWELGQFKHVYESDVVATADPQYDYSASSGATAGADDSGERQAGTCALDTMTKMYLGSDNVDQQCWYCRIVVVLVNAFLQAANSALGATTALGKVVLKLGFLIWLAYYILQQVSSMNAVTTGKIVQDILIMGLKVAMAYAAIEMGMQLIRDYYINPLVGTGVDYGMALFKGMNNFHGVGD